MKRYQECNWLIKLWRLRYYLLIPFKWVYYSLIGGLEVLNPEDMTYEMLKGKNLYIMLKSLAQFDMNWTYTQKEVDEFINKLKNESN